MQIVMLEGKKLINEIAIHKILKDKLELPDYYGENLDALWDCLTGWVSLPLKIVWKDYEYIKRQLRGSTDELLQLFLEAKNEVEVLEFEVE